MATLWISEYAGLVKLSGGEALPVGEEPATHTHAIPIEDESRASKRFQLTTRFVRLHADAPCSIRFGGPDATKADPRLVGTEVFGVKPGQSISVIANHGSWQMGTDSMQGFFQIIGDPQKAKAEYDRLNSLKAAAEQSISAAAERERAVMVKETTLADRERVVAGAETKVKAAQQGIASARLEHNTHVETFTAAESAWERARQEQEKELADRRTALDTLEQSLEQSLALLRDREAAAQAREDQLAADEKDYQDRMTALAGLATSRRRRA